MAVEYPAFLAADLFGSLLRFPLWWYGEGIIRLSGWMRGRLLYRWKSYAFVIWMQNLFVPMYGQYDWAGRLVSFVMRLVVLAARAVAYVFEILFYAVALVVYAMLPVIAALLFVFNLAAAL